jgi:hypothetical protein
MTANYFIIRESSDPKVVGIRNGGSQAFIYKEGFLDKSNYDKYYEFFADRRSNVWTRLDKMPGFELECPYMIRQQFKRTKSIILITKNIMSVMPS